MPEEERNPRRSQLRSRAPTTSTSTASKNRVWWRRIRDEDPITLQPIRSLRREPFNLPVDDRIECWFDARALSNYLVSTCNFTHPVSRRALTPEDITALDEHLTAHRISDPYVLRVYLNQDTEKEQLHIQALRQEADQVLEAILGAVSREHRRSPRRIETVTHPLPARVDVTPPPSSPPHTDEHFPSLGTESHTQPQTSLTWTSHTYPINRPEEFPALPVCQPSRPVGALGMRLAAGGAESYSAAMRSRKPQRVLLVGARRRISINYS